MSKDVKNIEFIEGVDFELIQNLSNNGTKYLLIFDDSCEEISGSNDFVEIATAGRHKGISTIYIKHNLFHQSRLGRDIELKNTHIVLFKSPRDVLQKNTLSQQLGLGSQLKDWYTKATSIPYVHLIIDLTPKQSTLFDFVQIVDRFLQFFSFHNINSRPHFRVMSTQHLSTLTTFQSYSRNFKRTYLKNCPKEFFQFLYECIVNMLRGELQDIQERDVIKYQDEIHQLILKRTRINKRRAILISRKGIELLTILTPSIINSLS